jgi:hypothetical protein
MLQRMADAGRGWAHQALEPDALLLFVGAGGFSPGFHEAAASSGRRVIAWSLDDLYRS